MKVNVNKDMLMKHRFWIMIGAAMLLSLFGIFMLQFGADVEADTGKLKEWAAKANRQKSPANADTRDSVDKNAKRASDLETTIWRDAFAAQAPVFKWSRKVEDDFGFYDGFFAIDVKLDKAPASVKEWPPTDPADGNLGILLDVQAGSFKIETRDKQVKTFMKTPSIDSVSLVGSPQKINYNDMINHKNKLATVTFQQGRYFGDALTTAEMHAFIDSYKGQITEILAQVDPLSDQGTGVVQLKDWLYRPDTLPERPQGGEPPFFRYVTKAWDRQAIISKDAWIAQENLWIQKEIYRLIAESNETVSKFKLKSVDKETDTHVFENAYFEVRLSLHKTTRDLTFEIKNRTSRRQKLDLQFLAKLNTSQAESIQPSGTPLMPAGSADKADTFKQIFPEPKGVKRDKIFGLEQVLTFETAAVKRVDLISIGSNDISEPSHSHRTYVDGLRGLEDGSKPAADAKPADGKAGDLKPNPLMPALPGAAPGNRVMTPYDQWTDRYIEPPDQARRIPVAIALIVDQEHVDRVLSQFNNSKLRLLLTQVLLNQHSGSLTPPQGLGAGGPKGALPIGNPPRPGGAGGGGGDADTNMELVMYGVMTLYQRYPPRPAPPPGQLVEKK